MVIILKKYFSILLSFVILLLSVLYCKIQHVSSENFFQNSFPIIIIDAGHGGEDGGAVAVDGTLEKNINLDISLKLRDIISVYGYKTKLIRQTDTDLHTEGDTIRQRKISDINHRFDIMKSYDNCLYVSVHQNKFNDSRIHGAQTFYSHNNVESKKLANFIQNSISYQLQRDNKRTIKMFSNTKRSHFFHSSFSRIIPCKFNSFISSFCSILHHRIFYPYLLN